MAVLEPAKRMGNIVRLGRLKKFNNILLPGLAFVALLLLWEVTVNLTGISNVILPKPSEIFWDIVTNWHHLLKMAAVTASESWSGFLLAAAIGVPFAVLVNAGSVIKNTVYPLLLVWNSIPKIAIAPLITIWIGYGLSSKVFVAFMVAFFPVVINAVAGLRSVPTELIDLGLSSGARRTRLFVLVIFPYALPNVFSGLKIAISLATIGAVVGEFVASNAGLGYFIITAQGTFNIIGVFSGIVVLSVVGIVSFYAVELLEGLLIPWNVVKRRQVSSS